MKTLIAIPARYGSTRFPGKPLAKIAGKEMLLRVWENAQKTAAKFEDCHAVVATDDERIADFCKSKNIACVMTSPDCPTGTDRVVEAAESFADRPEFVSTCRVTIRFVRHGLLRRSLPNTTITTRWKRLRRWLT